MKKILITSICLYTWAPLFHKSANNSCTYQSSFLSYAASETPLENLRNRYAPNLQYFDKSYSPAVQNAEYNPIFRNITSDDNENQTPLLKNPKDPENTCIVEQYYPYITAHQHQNINEQPRGQYPTSLKKLQQENAINKPHPDVISQLQHLNEIKQETLFSWLLKHRFVNLFLTILVTHLISVFILQPLGIL